MPSPSAQADGSSSRGELKGPSIPAAWHSTNEALSDAAEALHADRDRIAELEAELAAKGRTVDVSPQVKKLRALLAGQRAELEDPHDSPLHHDYRLGRDVPGMGDAR